VFKHLFKDMASGCRLLETGELFKLLLHSPTFQVSVVQDIAGVEVCAALKNIIAIGAGICDGLGYGIVCLLPDVAAVV